MNKKLGIGWVLTVLCFQLSAQTQQDTIYNYAATAPVVIDAIADEDCWTNAIWYDIKQVWMPYNAVMQDGDFEGRFKTAWDGTYLYVLVEVVDNMLSDDHSDPLDSWWDDDCLEVFIDEDRSGGWHQNDENAFAYHISTFYDAIDLGASSGVNYKEHVNVIMDTIADNTYLWEMAIKIYNDSYNDASPEDSRVTLAANKIMGFTIAYCDNDETTSRENFIGSIELPADKNNICYQDASYFGSMRLVDENFIAQPSILVSDPTGKVSESGSSATFDVRLYSEPESDVVINVVSGNEAEVTVSPESLTFTSANWSAMQTVTVTGVDDDIDDGDVSVTVSLSVDASSDAGYAVLDDMELTFKNSDNDETVGTRKTLENAFTIHPNPAVGYIVVGNSLNTEIHCEIFSLTGSKVLELNSDAANVHFDISSLPSGTYLVRITGGEIEKHQTLIKR